MAQPAAGLKPTALTAQGKSMENYIQSFGYSITKTVESGSGGSAARRFHEACGFGRCSLRIRRQAAGRKVKKKSSEQRAKLTIFIYLFDFTLFINQKRSPDYSALHECLLCIFPFFRYQKEIPECLDFFPFCDQFLIRQNHKKPGSRVVFLGEVNRQAGVCRACCGGDGLGPASRQTHDAAAS